MKEQLIGWGLALGLVLALIMAAQTDKGGFPCPDDELLTSTNVCITYDSIVDAYIDTKGG